MNVGMGSVVPARAADNGSHELSLWEQALLAAMVAADKEPPPPWKGPSESVWCCLEGALFFWATKSARDRRSQTA